MSLTMPNPPGSPFWNELNRVLRQAPPGIDVLYGRQDHDREHGVALYEAATKRGHAMRFQEGSVWLMGRKHARRIARQLFIKIGASMP